MVGAMLAKVLSRTKLSSSTHTSQDSDKFQHPYSSRSNIITPQTCRGMEEKQTTVEVKGRKSAISFEVKVKDKSPSRVGTYLSPRKHSYASIKEDSDTLQSFTTRRPLYEDDLFQHAIDDRRRWTNRKSRGANLATDGAEELDDEYTEDESAIINDSEDDELQPDVYTCAPPSLETMPDEILDLIFSYTTLSAETDRLLYPKVDLFSLLFVSRSIHSAALRVLYRHVKIPQSKAFFKFHNALAQDSQLGKLVQCLDFAHYSSIGFGRAKSTSVVTPYLTPKTLNSCLVNTTQLKAFLVHEHVDDELDTNVLSRLMTMPSLRALDLCGCSSTAFTQAFTSVCTNMPWRHDNGKQSFVPIERLSLHECSTLRPQIFEELLPCLNRLTHLDVAHTMINDKALMSIPKTARITHLNLERCTQITGPTVVEFLTTHPAVKDSIIYLNLQADASRYRLLSEDDLTSLLPMLPASLRSLNLGGSRINTTHVSHLQRLATHVEELGIKGADLSVGSDIRQILSLESSDAAGITHSLRYLDLTDVKSVNQMSLTYSPTTITGPETMPLEVIELSEGIRTDIQKRNKNCKNPEWVVSELGRRGWFVRKTESLSTQPIVHDDGYRKWKMGARWWGMRKIPMYEQETGGMYGYFMFKRA